MNRIIKFRGLAVSSGEMVYGCLIKKRYNALADWMIEDENGLGSDVVTESIGQFTGLLDVDGVELYEGDIVAYTLKDDSKKRVVVATIEWYKHAWRLNKIWLLTEISSIKVIGNIHQNKELLNAQN